MGKLVQLEVFNFKSYRGHHVLLFGDSYFTSIIGPNGSGKSNSMDAISFALGIKSSHLRSTNLRDLIYRGRVIRTTRINADGTATEANGDGDANGDTQENGDSQTSSQRNDPKFAWVKAVFQDDADQRHEWKRTINNQGQSEYRINDRVVSAKDYIDALEEQSILIKARNFLVFQGDVEKVASQDPKELTRLIEQISGSLDYKAEYERLKTEEEEASEQQMQKLTQKRQIAAELKQYKEQTNEAEAYEKKVKERDDAIVTHVLWKLFHFQQTIQDSSDEIAKHKEELKEHERGVEKYHQRLEEASQAHAKASREVKKWEKAIRSKEKEIEDAENELVPVDEKMTLLTKEAKVFEQVSANLKTSRDTQHQVVQRYKKDLATVEKAKEMWEREFRAAAQQEGRELSEQDYQEYNDLRKVVRQRTHATQMEVDNLERQLKTDEEEAKALESKVNRAEADVETQETELEQLQTRQQQLKAQLKSDEQEMASKQHSLNKMQSDRVENMKRHVEANQSLKENLRKLDDALAGQSQSTHQLRMRKVIQELKRAFGDRVIGRYRDNCRPTQKKYEEAVDTMLGWQLDAIIVDTESTARECIQHLEESKIEPQTFVPLDTVIIKAVDPTLKGIHKGARLGIDCLEYEPRLERAMASACGDSLICDNMNIARYLRFEKRVNARAITVDGSVIAKGGTMTGGRANRDQGKGRFSDAQINSQVENLSKAIEKQKAALAAMPRVLDHPSDEEQRLEDEVREIGYRVRFARDELKALERNITDKKKLLEHKKRELRDHRPKYEDAAHRLQIRKAELKRHQDTVDAVADEVFASFCQRLGYSSIRECDLQQGSVKQEAAEKRLEFKNQTSKLQNMLSFHEKSLKTIDERIANARSEAKSKTVQLQQLEKDKETMQEALDVLKAELETFKENVEKLRESLADKATVVSEQRRELERRNSAVQEVVKQVEDLEAEIKRTAASRYTLLRKAKVEEIAIPLAEGSADLNSLPMGDVGGPDADAMDIDEDPDTTQIHQPEIDDYGIEVDFDGLDDDLKEDNSPACDTRLKDAIQALNSEIEKANPNMRAKDRLEVTRKKYDTHNKDFEATRASSADKKKAFEKVKQKRLELFKKAFDHISENIGTTYKDLTKSDAFPLGGQAYLDMEDSNEPYLAGLKYHAMPPLKRFRDMEHLSGGEKTIAALALLFAIHSYQPSPFFVLDEVDAALDNINVGRVANYVQQHANPGMQFIVISLKAGFFQESESLVGVMRDQSKMSSRTVSLDLRKYLDTPKAA